MTLRIYLVRHGETEWSLNGRHTGKTDLPLTGHGEWEAKELGMRLPQTAFTHVFSSPRIRARRTCELAGHGAVMEVDADLAEWDYGDYEGLRTVEIRQQRPQWDIFRDGCPSGESAAQVCERVDRLISRLRLLTGKVALFTHGHLGRVFGARWIGLRVDQAEHFLLGTASISILEWDSSGAIAGTVAVWNAGAQIVGDPHVPSRQ